MNRLSCSLPLLAISLLTFPPCLSGASPRQAADPRQEVKAAFRVPIVGTVTNDPRFVPLLRFVDIDINDATLRVAAQALSKAANVSIIVDEKAPADARITLQARHVPLPDVLIALAEQTDLAISPYTPSASHTPTIPGVRLTRWPTLTVGANTQVYRNRYAPWSDEWGKNDDGSRVVTIQGRTVTVPPGKQPVVLADGSVMLVDPDGAGGGMGGGGFGGMGESNRGGGQQYIDENHVLQAVPPDMEAVSGDGGKVTLVPKSDKRTLYATAVGPGGMRFFRGGATPVPPDAPFSMPGASIAPLGNGLIAVAESALGPNGEPGLILTAYRFENGKFQNVGSKFHRFGTAPPPRKTGQITPKNLRELEVRPKIAQDVLPRGPYLTNPQPLTPAQVWTRSVEKRPENVKPQDVYFQTEKNGSRNVIYRLHLPNGSAQYVKEPAPPANTPAAKPTRP